MPTKYTEDSLENLSRRLGGTDDPSYATSFACRRLTYSELDNIYTSGSLVGKIVDIPIDDAMQKGRYIDDPELDEDEKKLIKDEQEAFDLDKKFNNAAKWARLYGGAVILIGIKDQQLSDPLDIDTLTPGCLEYLVPLDSSELSYTASNVSDIKSKNYRKPDFYSINGVNVHHTRVILFDGIDVPYRIREMNNGFGLSVIQRMFDDIFRAEHSAQSADQMLWNASNDVVRIPGLMQKVASSSESSALYTRFKLANDIRSNLSLMLLDTEEEFIRITQTFSGIVDLIRQNLEKVSASADIPATRLLGQSPNGLNATGKSDAGNYDALLGAIQTDLHRKYMTIDQIFLKHLGIKTETYSFKFNPLHDPTALETAQLENLNADRDTKYYSMGAITPDIIVKQLSEEGTYSAIDDEYIDVVESMTRETETASPTVTDRKERLLKE